MFHFVKYHISVYIFVGKCHKLKIWVNLNYMWEVQMAQCTVNKLRNAICCNTEGYPSIIYCTNSSEVTNELLEFMGKLFSEFYHFQSFCCCNCIDGNDDIENYDPHSAAHMSRWDYAVQMTFSLVHLKLKALCHFHFRPHHSHCSAGACRWQWEAPGCGLICSVINVL